MMAAMAAMAAVSSGSNEVMHAKGEPSLQQWPVCRTQCSSSSDGSDGGSNEVMRLKQLQIGGSSTPKGANR
jgi:hypothetical protein